MTVDSYWEINTKINRPQYTETIVEVRFKRYQKQKSQKGYS
ncbi:hypothetical protein [Candidatus Lokiarchaeum ossiferum]